MLLEPAWGLNSKSPGTEPIRASSPRLLQEVKGDLDWIVMKCLEKDRSRRYDTANGLAMDLQRHLNYEPVIARPPTAHYRFQKAFRRNRVVFTAAAVVAAALVIGIGVSTWQTFAARKASSANADRVKNRYAAKRRKSRARRNRVHQLHFTNWTCGRQPSAEQPTHRPGHPACGVA
jgi:hypothetical protein